MSSDLLSSVLLKSSLFIFLGYLSHSLPPGGRLLYIPLRDSNGDAPDPRTAAGLVFGLDYILYLHCMSGSNPHLKPIYAPLSHARKQGKEHATHAKKASRKPPYTTHARHKRTPAIITGAIINYSVLVAQL